MALYGKSYLIAAKDTLLMTKKCGLQALFNDDLVEGVLDTGKALGALAVCGTAGVLSWSYGLPWYLVCLSKPRSLLSVDTSGDVRWSFLWPFNIGHRSDRRSVLMRHDIYLLCT